MDKKIKGASPYNDKADNYNIDIGSLMVEISEAMTPTSQRTRLINYIILSFTKCYDFAASRKEADYNDAKRYLNVVLDILNDKK